MEIKLYDIIDLMLDKNDYTLIIDKNDAANEIRAEEVAEYYDNDSVKWISVDESPSGDETLCLFVKIEGYSKKEL